VVRQDQKTRAQLLLAGADLIQDPWIRHDCDGSTEGCAFAFKDPEFQAQSREIAYYVRTIQGPTPAVNAGGARCEVDEFGNCISANPCYGDYQTPPEDDCPWPAEERAWSSPIWVKP
jgi:hypothetical protein